VAPVWSSGVVRLLRPHAVDGLPGPDVRGLGVGHDPDPYPLPHCDRLPAHRLAVEPPQGGAVPDILEPAERNLAVLDVPHELFEVLHGEEHRRLRRAQRILDLVGPALDLTARVVRLRFARPIAGLVDGVRLFDGLV